MSTRGWTYVCERCGHQQESTTRDWRCTVCGGAFAIDGLPGIDSSEINQADPTLWRYAATLPVTQGETRTLGAGMTPLVTGSLAGRAVHFKLDGQLPTGSFKDRGAAVLVAHLCSLGLDRVIVDSSGNAAAAMSGFCAANGLRCTVYAPATTSQGKLVQSRAFGAEVVLVEGNREDVASAAQRAADNDPSAFYSSHNWHPVFVEGVKTWAIEVWEQLGNQLPTAVFVPIGGGSAFVGARRGFEAVGEQLPVLVAAQPAACSPIVEAFQNAATDIEPVTPATTMAEGTRIGTPSRGRQIMAAIRDCGGWAEGVAERQIVGALRELWAQGLYVEPTAAVGAAACIAAIERGQLPDGDVVVLLTGSGLKATETIATLLV